MNLKLKELSLTILKLDSGGSLESLYVNYSACLRQLRGPVKNNSTSTTVPLFDFSQYGL
jgi:hypothetical protein